MILTNWDRRRFWVYRYNTLYRPYFALGYVAVALFTVFAYFDLNELGPHATGAIAVRLALSACIGFMLYFLHRYRSLNAPLFEASAISAAGLFIVWVGELAINAGNYYYHSGIIMILVYLGTYSRMPWRFGLVTVAVISIPYLLVQSPQLFAVNPAVEEERLTVLGFTAIVGVIALYHRERQTRIRYEQWLRIRSQGIELRRSAALQQKLSETDSLTQVHNRTFLGKLMQQPETLAQIQQVLMIDIDYFKHLNDLYGHLTGDLVIQRVAATLKLHAPLDAECIRYGGEEFLLLCKEADERLPERLRLAIAQLKCEGVCQITVSIGSSQFDPKLGCLNQAIDDADHALYQAKQSGRNRHVAFIDEVA